MKEIEFTFNRASIRKAIEELQAYKEWLTKKMVEYCETLAQKGYEVATQNVEGFDGVMFRVDTEEVTLNGNQAIVYLVGYSDRQLKTWWNKKQGQVNNYDYSPILMAEFGSGKFAIDGANGLGGRGKFPTKTKHGLKDKWSYKESEFADYVETEGEKPTRPMLKATEEMINEIRTVAQEVFG